MRPGCHLVFVGGLPVEGRKLLPLVTSKPPRRSMPGREPGPNEQRMTMARKKPARASHVAPGEDLGHVFPAVRAAGSFFRQDPPSEPLVQRTCCALRACPGAVWPPARWRSGDVASLCGVRAWQGKPCGDKRVRHAPSTAWRTRRSPPVPHRLQHQSSLVRALKARTAGRSGEPARTRAARLAAPTQKVSRCALRRRGRSSRDPLAGWHAAPRQRHKYMVFHVLVTTTPACHVPLKVGTLPRRLTPSRPRP